MIYLESVKELYYLMPHVVAIWIILNILGNTIKMTFKVQGKYIVWILLIVSLVINFLFFGFNFESLFIGFVTFSFSVSSYDLVKYYNEIRSKKIARNVNKR